jgi:hypothetical protein
MNAGPTIADSAEGFRSIPRERMYREDFGGEVVYRCDIPKYWTDNLITCIKLGKHIENGDGYPFGPWGLNPAIIIEAVELFQSVRNSWREANGNG